MLKNYRMRPNQGRGTTFRGRCSRVLLVATGNIEQERDFMALTTSRLVEARLQLIWV